MVHNILVEDTALLDFVLVYFVDFIADETHLVDYFVDASFGFADE